ncbi:MAG: ABC transporter ATP-binding protein [Acidimicrobiia bacterium]|jgi:ABC-2 type transport system ATP-binding protein
MRRSRRYFNAVTQSLADDPTLDHAPTRPAVWTRGLVRKFGKTTAVDAVDLNVRPGEFYGLLGQNGAGKTTTIKCIVGLLRPTDGTAGIGEFDTWESPTEVKSRIGVLPEEFNLYERLTGAELLDFTAAMHGLDRVEALRRRNELLDMLDLLSAGAKLIGDYSRGMRKKIALGAAIIHRPPVLFLDEPFEGVDAVSARLIRNLLQQAAAGGTTIIFSSHEMHLVEKLCTRIGIMVDGRLTIEETPEGLCRVTGKDNVEDAFIAAVGGEGVDQLSWYETSSG